MIILDRLLVGGIKFVLGKVAVAVEQELNDDTALREQLLAAQMQVELGEMSEEDFAQLETEVLQAIREIRERREGGPRGAIDFSSGGENGEPSLSGITAEAEFTGEMMNVGDEEQDS